VSARTWERFSVVCAHYQSVTYLMTFSTYGSHLHGDERGSVDRDHNQPKARLLPTNVLRRDSERRSLKWPMYLLDDTRRSIVLDAIHEVCAYREWGVFAIHVRTNHVHVVAELSCDPRGAIRDFKAYASRALNRTGLDERGRRRWTEGGSARRLVDCEQRRRAIQYVVEHQGEQMAVLVATERL